MCEQPAAWQAFADELATGTLTVDVMQPDGTLVTTEWATADMHFVGSDADDAALRQQWEASRDTQRGSMDDAHLRTLAAEYIQFVELMRTGQYADQDEWQRLSADRGHVHDELLRLLGKTRQDTFDMYRHCKNLLHDARLADVDEHADADEHDA